MTQLRILCGTPGPVRATTAHLRYSWFSRRSLSDTVPEQLAGTVPVHHSYIFLRTPDPPSTYPAKYTSPVQRKLLLATAPWGGSVNFAWSPSQSADPSSPANEGTVPETHHLTAFSSTRGKLEIDGVSLANVEDATKTLRAHGEARTHGMPMAFSDDIHLYLCTHGARDCRCGDTGRRVSRAIRAELERRQWHDSSARIKLAEVAHVGGHKYAANVLVYPHGEWLGQVKPENVPDIIDAILARPVRPMHSEDMPLCPSHWRGRMGLSKDEQLDLFTRFSHKY
ncbi:Sucrase/ferredoxin-like-domain-containing protein [Chiua virens]|nr:Sucrase/ferredoxin-like-domain-containing protein [Chiua virens]